MEKELSLSERCGIATKKIEEKREELLKLQKDYLRVVKSEGSPMELLDIKESLISFSIELSPWFSRLKELHLQAQQERDNAFMLEFIKQRGIINENTNKPQSIDASERKAKLRIAADYLVEYHSDVNFTSIRKLLSDSQLLIDAAIQRASVVTKEMYNTRQPNTI
jgi:hypothetical protein